MARVVAAVSCKNQLLFVFFRILVFFLCLFFEFGQFGFQRLESRRHRLDFFIPAQFGVSCCGDFLTGIFCSRDFDDSFLFLTNSLCKLEQLVLDGIAEGGFDQALEGVRLRWHHRADPRRFASSSPLFSCRTP